MVDRITLKDTVYMQLDGQWQIVLSGSVVDVPSAAAYSSAHVTVQPGVGTLAPHGKPTSSSGIRTK